MAKRKHLEETDKREIEAIVNERFLEFIDDYKDFKIEVDFRHLALDLISITLRENTKEVSGKTKRLKEFPKMYKEVFENSDFINDYFGWDGWELASFSIHSGSSSMNIFISVNFNCKYS